MSVEAPTFPGIYFETAPRSSGTTLPRMDIAVFVGFASSGPLHTGVVVEDVQRFREIFGADVELAWDRDQARMEKSYLGASVDNFFRNGGKRCWVVRVADENIAQTASVEISGLIRLNETRAELARADLRSPGSWGESVRLRTVLSSRAFQLAAPAGDEVTLSIGSANWYAYVVANTEEIKTGDLMRIQLVGAESEYCLIAEEIQSTATGLRVEGTQGFYIHRDLDTSPAVLDTEFALANGAGVEGFEIYQLKDFADLSLTANWLVDMDEQSPPAIQKLTFSMRTLETQGKTLQLSELSGSPLSERFWGNLPTDEQLFVSTEGRLREKISSEKQQLINQAAAPRFPLAGPADADAWVYLPVSMSVNGGDSVRAEFAEPADKMTRDGIVNFGSVHFVDGRLSHLRFDSLLNEAKNLSYLSSSRRPLRGIHGALTLSEVTIIAVPDAIHRRWENLAPDYELPLAAPVLDSPQPSLLLDSTYRVSWSVVDNCRLYTLEWSESTDFVDANRVSISRSGLAAFNGDNNFLSPPDTEYFLTFEHQCPREYFFRVRAEHESEISAWSNCRALLIPALDFSACQQVPAQNLELILQTLSESPDGFSSPSSPPVTGQTLSWQLDSITGELGIVDSFELQRSKDINFFDAEVVFMGDKSELADAETPGFFVESEPDTPYYYRVRAMARQTIGPWSNTLILWPENLSQMTLQPDSDFSAADLLSVQRHLMRVALARGDVLAVLNLPRHYQVQDVLNHCAALQPSSSVNSSTFNEGDEFNTYTSPLGYAEKKASSYAALYYPWVHTHINSVNGISLDTRVLPPDGIVVAKIAEKSLEQGAWIAPANSPIKDLLALETPINMQQWHLLINARVNVIRKESRGYLLLSADTLSMETEWREINVRRLMSLLKRILEAEGNRLVFEPNNEFLRNSIKRQFESLLSALYRRGAFVGKNTNAAFRVVTDESVNTQRNIDNGQLVVELHVAPSLPLKFIRVRLIQEGIGQTTVEEFGT